MGARGRLEATAISLHTYPYVQTATSCSRTGRAWAPGYGPIVVAPRPLGQAQLRDVEIAVPGRMTTAFLVLRMPLGDFRYRVVPFDEILDEVKGGRAEAGSLVHEGQLTYGPRGSPSARPGRVVAAEAGLPLPLGVNVARRDLGETCSRTRPRSSGSRSRPGSTAARR